MHMSIRPRGAHDGPPAPPPPTRVTPVASSRRARQRRFLLDSLILGVIGAVAAIAFNFLLRLVQHVLLEGIAGYRAPGLPAEGGRLVELVGPHGLWLLPAATTIGGLLAG